VRLRVEISLGIGALLLIQVVTSVVATRLLTRMGPALEIVMEENVVTLEAAEDVLGRLAQQAGYDYSNPFVNGWLRLVQEGADTRLDVDRSGPGNGQNWQTLALLKNVDPLGLGERPSVTNFHRARNINDFLASLVFDRLFERFPNLRIASVENGAEFLGDLLKYLEKSKHRTKNYYREDPVESFKQHIWINPFWEDDASEIVSLIGADRVIIGSDWPHMEGTQTPRDVLEEVQDLPLHVLAKILRDNAVALNELRGA
jgi:hypothetical protein